MDFKDADINNLLRIIAEVSGMNVVAGGDVTGKVSVRLVNVEWQQALDVILRINGMGYEIDGNIIRVAPQAKLAAEQRSREEALAREQKHGMMPSPGSRKHGTMPSRRSATRRRNRSRWSRSWMTSLSSTTPRRPIWSNTSTG
jgi:type II secretory pathway component GspD/PulD (secretin)